MESRLDTNDIKYVTERNGSPFGGTPCPQDLETGKINPHVSRFYYGKDRRGLEKFLSVFHIKPIYYEHSSSTDEKLVFRPMSEVCTHYGNHLVVFKFEKLLEVHPRYIEWLRKRMVLIGGQVLVTSPFQAQPTPYNFVTELVHNAVAKPKVGMTVTTVYPDPNPETTTFDGANSGYSNTWSGVHDATSTPAGSSSTPDSDASIWPFYSRYRTAANYYTIGRGMFLFDTSTIGTDTIDSATLGLYGLIVRDNHTNTSRDTGIVQANPASNTAWADADWDLIGDAVSNPTEGATRIALSSLSASAYNIYTLNATGESWIDKTGVTKLGTRISWDLENTSPTPANSSGSGMQVASADTSGTTTDPKFAVTHSASTVTYRGMFALIEKA